MKLSAAGSSPTVQTEDPKAAHEAWRAQRRYVRRTVARIPELKREAMAVALEPWEPPVVVRAPTRWRWTVSRERF